MIRRKGCCCFCDGGGGSGGGCGCRWRFCCRVARTCSEDCVVDGVQFRRGTVVRLMGSVQYRDPDVYPDPEKFTPDRSAAVCVCV